MAERIVNFVRSIWKELKIVMVLIFAMDNGSLSEFLPDGVDRGDLEQAQAFKAVKAALGLEAQAEDMDIDVSLRDLKCAPRKGLDIRFITRRQALRSLLKLRLWLIPALSYK